MGRVPRGMPSSYLTPPAGSGGSGVAWTTMDYSTGTVYGTAAVVTARDAGSITVDDNVSAAAFLDNAPDNRGDYWWLTQGPISLSGYASDAGLILMLDVTRSTNPSANGVMFGAMFHVGANPTTATNYSGLWIRRKTNSDGNLWAINNVGNLGGWSAGWTLRQRAQLMHVLAADRDEIISGTIYPLMADGTFPTNEVRQTMEDKAVNFSTGDLYVSVIAGTYQPKVTPDGPTVFTPSIRWAVVPTEV